jgi:hypothetical protein
VAFTTSAPATAALTATGVIPGSSGSSCIKVNYQGPLSATVKMYVATGGLTGTGLGTYLTFQVNEGTGANAACTDFVKSASLYNATGMTDTTKTVATFAAATTNYATGVSSWAATAGTTRTYQFTWRVIANNAAQGKDMTVTFTWEGQH